MAAGNFTLYNSGHLNFFDGTFKFGSDTVKAVLLSASYTPAATHSTYADISATEITDTDYAEQTVTGTSVTQASGTVTVSSADISFGSNVTITAKYLVLVQQASGSIASTDKLIGYVDLNTTSGSSTVSSTSSTFAVNPNASGLFTDA